MCLKNLSHGWVGPQEPWPWVSVPQNLCLYILMVFLFLPLSFSLQLNLEELSCSGTTINELEVQLTRHKDLYHKALAEGRQKVDYLAKKLDTHIKKSEPFVVLWRRAKEVR